ncbi:uncharacterized protein B0I36DRAFT_354556 [Microdochium trichocladiopsis]|uniref:Uncharacterized protein n=1 Tax=Microdochium trichocladiopsis TaxID=1682393 RepID=A0A9P9BJL1_9PEZI|nr:uncharacterized protein B0I36DRAFT_354556 [Microdochium trichocladiopsis]KAH7018258.1 hypothetical protein B0I36DRAFT_354556 [Microdochium trichocladiopsis]
MVGVIFGEQGEAIRPPYLVMLCQLLGYSARSHHLTRFDDPSLEILESCAHEPNYNRIALIEANPMILPRGEINRSAMPAARNPHEMPTVAFAPLGRRDVPSEQVGIIVGCCLGAIVLVLLLVWCIWSAGQRRAWREAGPPEEDFIYIEESDFSGSRSSRRRQHEAYRLHVERLRQMHLLQQMQAQQSSGAGFPPFPRSIPPPTLRPGEKPVYRVKRQEPRYNTWEYATRGRR